MRGSATDSYLDANGYIVGESIDYENTVVGSEWVVGLERYGDKTGKLSDTYSVSIRKIVENGAIKIGYSSDLGEKWISLEEIN